MNASVVVSISAALVGMVLFIVLFLRKDKNASFTSLKVTGVAMDPTGVTVNSEMYYCDSNNGVGCNLYNIDIASNPEFPGYYALVGFQDDTKTYLTEYSIGFTFEFDTASETLLACAPVSDPDAAAAIKELSGDVADGTVLTDSSGGSFTIGTITKNPDDTKVFGFSVPDSSKCAELNLPAGSGEPAQDGTGEDLSDLGSRRLEELGINAEAIERDENGRVLWSGGSATDKELWEVSQAAYGGALAPSGWTHWTTCENKNAVAKFIYKYPIMTISFAGTDGLTDFGDWMDNMDTDLKWTYYGTVHEGFYEYQDKVQACVNNYKNMLAGWGIDIDYVVGHSLGGAAATVYYQQHNPNTNGKLLTFGAPKTRADSYCTSEGIRFAHEKDSVASNALGIMGAFNHDIKDSTVLYEESYCSSRCGWWGWCCPWGWVSRKKTKSQGCRSNSGGCSFLLDCAYYFATVHGDYGSYL